MTSADELLVGLAQAQLRPLNISGDPGGQALGAAQSDWQVATEPPIDDAMNDRAPQAFRRMPVAVDQFIKFFATGRQVDRVRIHAGKTERNLTAIERQSRIASGNVGAGLGVEQHGGPKAFADTTTTDHQRAFRVKGGFVSGRGVDLTQRRRDGGILTGCGGEFGQGVTQGGDLGLGERNHGLALASVRMARIAMMPSIRAR